MPNHQDYGPWAMILHHFWCVKCGEYTTDVLKASIHEEKIHNEMRKIGTTPVDIPVEYGLS